MLGLLPPPVLVRASQARLALQLPLIQWLVALSLVGCLAFFLPRVNQELLALVYSVQPLFPRRSALAWSISRPKVRARQLSRSLSAALPSVPLLEGLLASLCPSLRALVEAASSS